MTQWRQLLMGSLILGGLYGCSLSIEIRGVVRTMPTEPVQGDTAEGKPIEDAALTLLCADSEPRDLARSDEQGRFHVELEERVRRNCQLEVSKSGYTPRIYEVEQVCVTPSYEYEEERCRFISLTARLIEEEGS